jgi:hypothetical protein
MDPDRARQLLNAERARIVPSLAQLRHADTAEPNDYVDSAVNLRPSSKRYDDSDELRTYKNPTQRGNCAAKRGPTGRRYVATRTAAAAVSIIVTTSSGCETIAT